MKLFCRIYGSGPPLIILHGLYGSSDNWMTVARKISRHFTVYLPDKGYSQIISCCRIQGYRKCRTLDPC
ncbi:MAG: hypothetical protein A2Z69_03575 [Bacteroidetes bacterium RBG_13_44_24]|nr:MAG: hypothetical protein A2Z69_03575 [Bacteroidetes bacterium RBG_13_44_24]